MLQASHQARLLLLCMQTTQPARLSDSSACLPQIANSFGNGVDKLAFHQRQEHVQERLNLVLDSAERPFEGARRAQDVACFPPFFNCIRDCQMSWVSEGSVD